jgi:CDP-diacylglycerol pyrophosphatase
MDALMNPTASLPARLFNWLRLSEFGWARRTTLVAAALLGSAAFAYAANLAGRTALWQVVRACTLDKTTLGSPLPCLDVNLDDGFAVLRPPVGNPDTILTPTRRVVGLEDPALQAADAPNYFALAWGARRFLPAREPPVDERVALAVNSVLARSQDQLHIHIGCLTPGFAQRLRARALGPKPGVWFRGPDLGRKLELWTYRSGSRDWAGLEPFRLARDLIGDERALARTTLAVIATPAEYVVIALRSLPGGWFAQAEDVMDSRC